MKKAELILSTIVTEILTITPKSGRIDRILKDLASNIQDYVLTRDEISKPVEVKTVASLIYDTEVLLEVVDIVSCWLTHDYLLKLSKALDAFCQQVEHDEIVRTNRF